MNPKISIVTVSYNSEKTIEETILSVINQNYSNKEYIIVDGGSTDNTMAIIEKYRSQIATVISERDKGISDAFNKGILLCTGELIGLINSDDLLKEGALEMVAAEYEEGIEVYRGNTIMWNETTGFKCIEYPCMNLATVPFNLHVCHPSTFITKAAYHKFGNYRVDYKYIMDLDLLIRFSNKKAKSKYINKQLAVFRLGGVSQVPESKKMAERKNMVISNGGNNLQAFVFQTYLVTRQIVKKLVSLFGEDLRLKFVSKEIK